MAFWSFLWGRKVLGEYFKGLKTLILLLYLLFITGTMQEEEMITLNV